MDKTQGGWSNEVPTEPGFYFMYGWVGDNIHHKPELYLVEGIMYKQKYLYFDQGGYLIYGGWVDRRTLWKPLTIPQLPTNEEFFDLLSPMGVVGASKYFKESLAQKEA